MTSVIQLAHAAILAAAMLSSSASSTGRLRDADRTSRRDVSRMFDLMEPVALAVLDSFDRGSLDENIDEQLFSGLFSDLLLKSMQAVVEGSHIEPTDVEREQLVLAIESMGGSRSKVEEALRLSSLSSELTSALVRHRLAESGDMNTSLLRRFDVSEFLYDVSIPLEVRAAAQADLESAICAITLAYLAVGKSDVARWLVAELVDRWLAGPSKSLPLLAAIAAEQALVLDDLSMALRVKVDEFHEQGLPDLGAAEKSANSTVEQLRAIAEHADRQPDGLWPKS